jgi:hypothetical protein
LLFGRKDPVNSKSSDIKTKKSGLSSLDEDEQYPHSRKTRESKESTMSMNEVQKTKDEDDDVAKRSSSKFSRVPSKFTILSWPKAERPQPVVMTDDMIRLETLIQTDKAKQRLVQEVLTLRGDYSVKIRFCSAIDTFDAAVEQSERDALAQTIIQTFLAHGCLFYISSLSDARYVAIVIQNHFNQLLDAKREVLEELSRIPEVMEIVNHVETLD